MPFRWLLPLQIVIVLCGLLGALIVLSERARWRYEASGASALALAPWLLLALGMALAAIWIFSQPMEMRGTSFFSP